MTTAFYEALPFVSQLLLSCPSTVGAEHMDDFGKIVKRILIAPDHDLLLQEFDEADIVAAVLDVLMKVPQPNPTTETLTAAVDGLRADEATLARTVELIATELPEPNAAACVLALASTADVHERLLAAGMLQHEIDALIAMHDAWPQTDWVLPLVKEDSEPYMRGPTVLSDFEMRQRIRQNQTVVDEIVAGYRDLDDEEAITAHLDRYNRTDACEALVDYLHHAPADHWHHTAWMLMSLNSSDALVTTRLLRLVEDDTRPMQLRNLAFHALAVSVSEPHELDEAGLLDKLSPGELSDMLDAYYLEWAMVLPDDSPMLRMMYRSCDAARFDRVCDQIHAAGVEIDWKLFLMGREVMHLWPRIADELVRTRDEAAVERLRECAAAVRDDDSRARLLRAAMRLESV